MNEDKKELISKNTSLAPLSTGLASRGLQVARQMAQPSYGDFTNSIGMRLVLISKGKFQMGAPIKEKNRWKDEVQHEVTISKDYYLSVTQVTQGQYEKVTGTNPSRFQGKKISADSDNHPVEQVSWEDVVEFCKKLSELPEEKKAGRVYRLPSEAEWEYACRAGSNTAYCFGNEKYSLSDYAWFADNSSYQTHPVGEKKPNAWGLYDMHGNVWELCRDWYDYYIEGAVIDPSGPTVGRISYDEYYYGANDSSGVFDSPYRVYRGGCCGSEAEFCRSACRYGEDPSEPREDLGFRVALSSTSGIPKSTEADK
jgi:formylglycine-generating enzyme required for sulfatase activity